MKHEEITHKIIGSAYNVFNQLGFGFLESVYRKSMVIELKKTNLEAEEEVPLKVYYDDKVVGEFYIDLLVEKEIVVELKSVQNLIKVDLDFESIEFYEDTRLRACSCSTLPQTLGNAGDPLKSVLPKGKQS